MIAGEVQRPAAQAGRPLAPPEERVVFDAHMGARLPLRILLAEDNLINQKLALILLERLGYRADVVENGREVVAALQRQAYDTILMDVQMPELDGMEATRLIRRDFPPDRQPHIIAVTANAMRKDRELCVAAGMNDYVSKPVELRELVEVLEHARALLDLKSAPSAVAAPPDLAPPPVAVPVAPAPPAADLGAAAGAPVLDLAALKRLQDNLGKRQTLLPGLIEAFLADAVKLQVEARQALERGDAKALRRAVHTLKSSSANFGALALSALCRDLEQRVIAGDLDETADRLADIDRAYGLARDQLAQVRAALAGQPAGPAATPPAVP